MKADRHYPLALDDPRLALVDGETRPEHRLVTLEIDSDDTDAWGFERVWYKDELAGFVTSGAYGHTVGKSLAMAYLKTPFIESGVNDFLVHVVDQLRPATVPPRSPMIPAGHE